MVKPNVLIGLLCVLISLSEVSHAQPQGLEAVPETPDLPIVQGFPGLTPEQVKLIMEHSQKVQDCLNTEGKESLKRLQERSAANGKELKALCLAGKNDEARERAIEQAKETAESDDMKVVNKCRNIMDELSSLSPGLGKKNHIKNASPEETIPADICAHARP